jgi:hypothetical protein
MKSTRWLALAVAVVGIFLLAEGAMAVWSLDATDSIAASPIGPYSTPEDIAWARSLRPLLFLVSGEGLVFGFIAILCAVGLVLRRNWPPRVLLPSSVILALCAAAAIAIAPHTWDMQGLFILFCALYWWELRNAPHKGKASAL